MPLPWLQIVQLVPSIVDVSRELLKRSKRMPEGPTAPLAGMEEAAARIAALEENERRQAELISQMAQQMAALTRAITALHQRVLWLSIALGVTLAVAIGAYFAAA
jgi:hypothetical protein